MLVLFTLKPIERITYSINLTNNQVSGICLANDSKHLSYLNIFGKSTLEYEFFLKTRQTIKNILAIKKAENKEKYRDIR